MDIHEPQGLHYSTAGEVRYLDHLDLYKIEKPYEVTFLPVNVTQPGARRSNLSLKSWPVEIRDFSAHQQSFNTDTQGFELDAFPTSLSVPELKDLSTVESRYHPEAITYLQQKYGAEKVFIFDTTVSVSTPSMSSSNVLCPSRYEKPRSRGLTPAHYSRISRYLVPQRTVTLVTSRPSIICAAFHPLMLTFKPDQSPNSVRRRVQYLFPDEAEALLRYRVRVIK